MKVALVAGLEVSLVPALSLQPKLWRAQLFAKLRRTTFRAIDQRIVTHFLQGIERVLTRATLITVDRHCYSIVSGLPRAANYSLSCVLEIEPVLGNSYLYGISRTKPTLQDLLRQRVFYLLLDRTLKRPRPVHRIESRIREFVTRGI